MTVEKIIELLEEQGINPETIEELIIDKPYYITCRKYENIEESIIFAYENMEPQLFEKWVNKITYNFIAMADQLRKGNDYTHLWREKRYVLMEMFNAVRKGYEMPDFKKLPNGRFEQVKAYFNNWYKKRYSKVDVIEKYLLNADCPNKVVRVINKLVEDGRPIPTNDENWTVEDYENYIEQKKVNIL